ncbi:MAG: hypothetical protein PHH14_06115 [Candidatus Margulisbacteria bacterium]|nr:hypothetical protein [Candidatus Margulisiibacteriota bacterium]
MKKLALIACLFFLTAGTVLAEQVYPQIDLSGFKKWESKNVEVNPSSNYMTGLSYLGGYYQTYSGGPWQERLQLRILGQLSPNLSVSYDLEQQPETPEKFDVKVKYYNTELTFGDFNATFSGNEFVSASKYLNGVMLSSKDSWYDVLVVPSSKVKSQTQALATQKGSNIEGPYNLGHGSIVEGTEQIQLNNVPLKKNVDYTIDYFEGKITFNRILDTTDEFKYSYEYTNMIDLFFPTLSKRDFVGFQSRLTIDPDKFGKPEPKEEPVISSSRDLFPSEGTVEPEVQEGESAGRYCLKYFPIVKFSERLTMMGTQLKKNEDYIIRYDTGEIKLLTRFIPSPQDPLAIEYSYYLTSSEVEAIPGIGSRGPYKIRHRDILLESERIEVDGKLFVRDLDYTIDYNKGELVFGVVISQTSQIKASYRFNVRAFPKESTSKFPKEFKLGVTYLKESAKKSTNTATTTVIESYTGQAVINNNYALYLKNRPVVPSGEAALIIKLNGRLLTEEVDYALPTTEVDPATGFTIVTPPAQLAYITDRTDLTDGHGTGTVYFFNQSVALAPADEITVTYSYYKGVVGKYSAMGDGSKGPYYLRNVRNIVPGTETLQVWEQGASAITTYTRNASFEANAGTTGYSINYNDDNPSITFNNELSTTKNFQVVYQYIPLSSSTSGDISLSAYGVDGSFKIGDAIKIDSSYAKSESDQVYVSETKVESFNGNNTKIYLLTSEADLIDGSDQIYVNNQLLNRDIDYYISYTKPGQFNFYYITPTTLDAISVQYNFQSTAGLSLETKTKSDTAFRLGAETKLFGDTLTLNGTTKKIGFDFSPLGSTAIGVGSEYEEYNMNYKPAWQSFFTNYSYKYNKIPIGSTRTTFLRSYDHLVTTGINPGGFAKIDFGYRSVNSIDDPLSSTALHNNDSLQESISSSLVPSDFRQGAMVFSQKYELKKTTTKSDTVDQAANKSTATIDYWHAGGELKLTNRFTLGYDYQYNEPVTTGSLETITLHTRTIDRAANVSLDLTTLFLQKWIVRASLVDHFDYKITPESTTVSTKNETYHMEIVPFPILTAAYDHSRQERLTFLLNGANPLSLRSAATTRLTPVPWFSIGLAASKNEAVPETGIAYKTAGRSYSGDIDYTPLSLTAIRFNAKFSGSDANQLAPLGNVPVLTTTKNFSQNYTLNLNFIPIMPIAMGLIIDDYRNYNDSITSHVLTSTKNQTTTANTSLTLPALPQLSLMADYSHKITKNLLTDDSRPKTVTNGKASYQLFNWGTIAYDVAQERNEGEVQAGVLTQLNFWKATETYSLNITIPVDNPVLNNFVVLASYKRVTYNDFNNSANDFKASLLSLEGTLNF